LQSRLLEPAALQPGTESKGSEGRKGRPHRVRRRLISLGLPRQLP
jgi:hypothetical protein